MNGDKKLTHVLSVSNPNQINYSYDLKQGEIFQVWRGKFINVTPSWRDRGGMQIAVPLGNVIRLTDAPPVTILSDEKSSWPDSVTFDSMDNKGYVLDKKRTPTFNYIVHGLNVSDSMRCERNNEGISRTIAVNNPSEIFDCRIAAANKIEHIGGDLYAVNDKSYYIKLRRNINR